MILSRINITTFSHLGRPASAAAERRRRLGRRSSAAAAAAVLPRPWRSRRSKVKTRDKRRRGRRVRAIEFAKNT